MKMSLTAGIVGLPNVGKSTLFNAITKQNILAANYPFATIEPNVGIVTVPDERVDFLKDLYVTLAIFLRAKSSEFFALLLYAHTHLIFKTPFKKV